jgi:hypothetical protein
VRSALLLGRDHHDLGAVATVAEGPAAISLCRGGARKTYEYTEPNEDAVLFALGEGGWLAAVADGHHGASGAEAALEHLESELAPGWTGASAVATSADDWAELARNALLACNHAVLSRGAELGIPPAPTTLSIALVRPNEQLIAWACMGDSHVFLVDHAGARDVGWASTEAPRTYYLGYEAPKLESLKRMSVVGWQQSTLPDAVVLATDGVSEKGIGLADPAAGTAEAVASARSEAKPELRPLHACNALTRAAMRAQREQHAGDNIGCAVLWTS